MTVLIRTGIRRKPDPQAARLFHEQHCGDTCRCYVRPGGSPDIAIYECSAGADVSHAAREALGLSADRREPVLFIHNDREVIADSTIDSPRIVLARWDAWVYPKPAAPPLPTLPPAVVAALDEAYRHWAATGFEPGEGVISLSAFEALTTWKKPVAEHGEPPVGESPKDGPTEGPLDAPEWARDVAALIQGGVDIAALLKTRTEDLKAAAVVLRAFLRDRP